MADVSTASTVSYLVKVNWIQRWAAACGQLNECEGCKDAAMCQRTVDSIINGCYQRYRGKKVL